MNMKNILRFMGALALTTGATTSVVACNQSSGVTGVTMNTDVSKQLGLTNDKGEGMQEVTLNASKPNEVMWSVPALATPITADKLLVAEDKAANQSCFDFITNVLKVKPKAGTKLDDGVFDKAALTAITGEVTNITPTLKKMEDNKDYAISAGTFSFKFKKDKEKIGDVYNIKLKVDDTKGVVNAVLATIVGKFTIADTDVANNENIHFKVGENISEKAKPGLAIKITGETEAVKQFDALNKLTDLKITAKLGSINHFGSYTWLSGDKLKIVYKVGDVTFATETELTL